MASILPCCFPLRESRRTSDPALLRVRSKKLRLQHPQRVGFGYRILSGMDVEFAVDVDGVSFDGLGGYEKFVGDLPVFQPLRQQG